MTQETSAAEIPTEITLEEIKARRLKDGRRIKAAKCVFKQCGLKATNAIGEFFLCDFHQEVVEEQARADEIGLSTEIGSPQLMAYRYFKAVRKDKPEYMDKIIFDDPMLAKCNEEGVVYGDRRSFLYRKRPEQFIYELAE